LQRRNATLKNVKPFKKQIFTLKTLTTFGMATSIYSLLLTASDVACCFLCWASDQTVWF